MFGPLYRRMRWKHIVIHHSASDAGNAEVFDAWHRQRGLRFGLAYHFVIGNGKGSGDGAVEIGNRWEKQLWGAHVKNRTWNLHSIGICLVGNFEHDSPTPRQISRLEKLILELSETYGIEVSEMKGHKEVPGEHTLCPGSRFDLDAFRSGLGVGPGPFA